MKNLKYKGNTTNPDKRIWDEYEDEHGNSSLEIHEPKKITNYDNCEHYYEYADNGNDAVCKNCGLGHKIILGLHFIKDGKVINNLHK